MRTYRAGSIFLLLMALVAELGFPHIAMASETYSIEPWRRVLEKYQNLGGIDYQGLQSDRADLDVFLEGLSTVRLDGWTIPERIAFWCNAYNAVVVFHVLELYPEIESVKKVNGFFDELEYKVANRSMTLDEIETAARSLGDPRVHFAVVCASTSCPDLQADPFEGAILERQLEEATRGFLTDAKKGMRFEPREGTVYLSSIFKWYAGDFTGGSTAVAFFARGGVLDWVLTQLPQSQAESIRETSPKVRYLDYDWGLNDRPK
ncbi:MAG: DUF547 domain-containing protein [Acidobacteriota bacterium]